MEDVHVLTLVLVLVGVLVVLARAVRGPTLLDRILAVNVISTKTIVLLALVGFWHAEHVASVGSVEPELDRAGFFVDIALAYALINFIATIAVLRYLEGRARGRTPEGEADAP